MVSREPPWARAVKDVSRAVFILTLATGMFLAAYLPNRVEPLALDIFGRILAALAIELVLLAVLREIVPRPHEGAHRLEWSKEYLRWLVSSSLAEVGVHPSFRLPFWALHVTRVMYLRALRMEIALSAGFEGDIIVREPSLASIGKGSQVEPGVVIEAALHKAGRVRIAKVIIGERCMIGAHSVLMPGATIGHEARIEPAAVIGEDVHVGVGAAIGEGVRLEHGVDLGSYVTIGTGAIISRGAKIGERARIAPGAIVGPYEQIAERAVWEGDGVKPSVKALG